MAFFEPDPVWLIAIEEAMPEIIRAIELEGGVTDVTITVAEHRIEINANPTGSAEPEPAAWTIVEQVSGAWSTIPPETPCQIHLDGRTWMTGGSTMVGIIGGADQAWWAQHVQRAPLHT